MNKKHLSLFILFVMCAAALACACAAAEGVAPAPGEESVHAVEVIEAPRELGINSEGDQVKTLQKKLYQLGFFTQAIDGVYGDNTRAAVKELEEYRRSIEQRDIDAYTPEPTPANTPEPTFEGVTAVETPEPSPTPKPTPAPTPETVVDGVCDLALQDILYGDVDEWYLRDVSQGTQGIAAKRIQRRLATLNYLNDGADGIFGVNSVTALKAFQERNGLPVTGIADRQTQNLMFGENPVTAKKPVYNQLVKGMSGDIVKAVQTQLITLGFMNGSASGYYDQATVNGVMALEKYLYLLDNSLYTSGDMGVYDTLVAAPDGALNDAASLAENGDIGGDPELNPYEVTPETESLADQHGFVATGVMSDALIRRLLEDGIQIYTDTVREGDRGDNVQRVQRRLASLDYLTASGADGIFGKGTRSAVVSFQKRNHIEATGLCDQATQYILFTADAVRSIKPYMIKVSIADQRVYVYVPDENDNYTVLVQKFVCSTGTKAHPTPKGTFKNTGRGAEWHYFTKFDCWARYAWYVDGDIMIHSVLYSKQDVNTLRSGSVSALGSRASHGCIRLAVEDARWIWEHCSSGTTVVVY